MLNKPKAAHEAKELNEDEWREIEERANVLMAGYVLDEGDGRPAGKYINDDPGGEVWILKERDARIAMTQLLRSGRPLTQDFRDRLAALFDPEAGTHPAIDRKLIFKHRTKRPIDHVRGSAIAMAVCESVLKNDATVTQAWEEVGEKFHLSADRIKQIWSARRKPIICGYIHVCILDGDPETKALEKAERRFRPKNEATKEEPIKKSWSRYLEGLKQIEPKFYSRIIKSRSSPISG